MPTRDEFDEARALFDEAVAMYEAAKAEFEALQRAIQEHLKVGEVVLTSEWNKEEVARVSLLHARNRLSQRRNPRTPS